ncbi:DUF6474 family protein [Nakamurella endophytica]|uniref:Uncharacterized protein n=1 Tax=Nakamurella endophytica TaxID=1748367 RepID=A0A917WKF2_9ACTN|nr:DUF6474 family protein [Nakamurella endophytica]GGM10469.1 hypothetical protein GCM10011594_32960 [Nakamurella endophytica]
MLRSKKSRRSGKSGKDGKQRAPEQPRGAIATLTDPKTARNAVAVARLAGPALAPLALRASTAARSLIDHRRAAKLGVPVDQVAAYRGPAGPSLARIDTLEQAVEDLRRRRGGDTRVAGFADTARGRFADLRAAAHAAAPMPPGRRRVTLRAIGGEISRLESALLTYLVNTSA